MVRQVRSVTEKSQKSPKTWVVVFVSWVRFGGAKERRRSLPPHCAPLSGRLAGGEGGGLSSATGRVPAWLFVALRPDASATLFPSETGVAP